jgi:hypothetical protein
MGKDAFDSWGLPGVWRSCGLTITQHTVHLRDDVGSVGRSRDTQEVVLLEVLRGVVTEANSSNIGACCALG